MRHVLVDSRRRRAACAALVLGAVALLGAGGADSARLTVCSSGCRYTTIPAALAAASNGDTIAVGPGTYSGEFTITASVRVVGAGPEATRIVGDGRLGPAVVTIARGATVALSGVTLTGGENGFSGGGITNLGNIALSRSTLDDNGASEGGGIYNADGATAAIARSTISHNVAGSFGENPCCGQGGAIYNEGTLHVVKTAVLENVSGGDSGNAGGIWNGGSATMTLSDSRVAGNTTDGFFGASGGGITNGGAMGLRRTVVSDNTAHAADGFAAGGGIYNFGTLTLMKSPVTGNAASGAELYGSSGGGIYNHSLGALTLFKSPVTGNTPDNCIGC